MNDLLMLFAKYFKSMTWKSHIENDCAWMNSVFRQKYVEILSTKNAGDKTSQFCLFRIDSLRQTSRAAS